MHDAWVVIAYSLPPEPSRLRVAAWRRMKSAGAVHVNEGFWFLPRTAASSQLFEDVAREVRAQSGTAWTFTADAGSLEQAALTSRFNEARAADFREVVRHCERFLAHIEREATSGHFEFEVIAELEQDLEKRARMLRQAHERDLLACDGGDEADQRLQQCRDALERFTEDTYRKTGDV